MKVVEYVDNTEKGIKVLNKKEKMIYAKKYMNMIINNINEFLKEDHKLLVSSLNNFIYLVASTISYNEKFSHKHYLKIKYLCNCKIEEYIIVKKSIENNDINIFLDNFFDLSIQYKDVFEPGFNTFSIDLICLLTKKKDYKHKFKNYIENTKRSIVLYA